MFNDGIIRWLDSQPPSSLVMGSFELLMRSKWRREHVACALEQSGYRFICSLHWPPSASMKSPRWLWGTCSGIVERVSWANLGNRESDWVGLTGGSSGSSCNGKVCISLRVELVVGEFVVCSGLPWATWPISTLRMVVELGLSVEIKLDYKNELYKLLYKLVRWRISGHGVGDAECIPD